MKCMAISLSLSLSGVGFLKSVAVRRTPKVSKEQHEDVLAQENPEIQGWAEWYLCTTRPHEDSDAQNNAADLGINACSSVHTWRIDLHAYCNHVVVGPSDSCPRRLCYEVHLYRSSSAEGVGAKEPTMSRRSLMFCTAIQNGISISSAEGSALLFCASPCQPITSLMNSTRAET